VSQSLRFCQTRFTPPQLLFRAPAILNVDPRSIPGNNFSLLVAQGNAAVEKPAIFAVACSAKARFILERLAGSDRRPPLFKVSSEVIGV
jgi:hypothetical protein